MKSKLKYLTPIILAVLVLPFFGASAAWAQSQGPIYAEVDRTALTTDEVLAVIDNRPPSAELVLTGRRVPEEIIARADYVTEMREIKHPYRQGILARKGIEH